jgi:hypothetical protein
MKSSAPWLLLATVCKGGKLAIVLERDGTEDMMVSLALMQKLLIPGAVY